MVICSMFDVYKVTKEGMYQYIDGRIHQDISKKDKLIVVINIDQGDYKKYHDENGCRYISSDADFEEIYIDSIFSYGKYWEDLNAGMSARLICLCDRTIMEGEMLYRIISL